MIPLNARIWLGLSLVALILLVGIFVPMLIHENPDALNPLAALLPPSAQHLMGTDQYGRDIFLRVAYAARLDLAFGIAPVIVSMLIGSTLGIMAGYFGGWTETIVMRLVDVMVAFPYLVLVIVIIALIGPGIFGMIIALVAVDWTVYARLIRGEALVVKKLEYTVAGRLLGYSHPRIILRHVLPNVVTPALVYSMVDVVNTILVAATLSYLGLGVQPPTPEWGAMISDGQNFIFQAWWMTVMPGIALIVTGVGLSLVADGIAEMIEGG
jgi:peptide/nickel transport system permease protein